MTMLRGFIAGAMAVALFHQPVLALLNFAGVISRASFSMDPTRPFGVPAVLSLAFWGCVWGVIFVLTLARLKFATRAFYWAAAAVFGAFAPTLVAWFAVAPLKDQPLAGGFEPAGMASALLVNAAWGLGTALLLRLLRAPRPAISLA